jgi:hypothetical protein
VFGQSATNIRRRVLAAAVKRADERLAENGRNPLPAALTPHSLASHVREPAVRDSASRRRS